MAEYVVLGRPWQGGAVSREMQNGSVRLTGRVSGVVGVRKVNLKAYSSV